MIEFWWIFFPLDAAGGSEKNRKRDVRDWYHSEKYRDERFEMKNNLARRGDIPIIHGDCDENLQKSMAELIALVKQLREEVREQRGEIQYLRQMLENCAGCKEGPAPIREGCQYNNPCFPGKLMEQQSLFWSANGFGQG